MRKQFFTKLFFVSAIITGALLASSETKAFTEAGDGDTIVVCPVGDLYVCATIGMEGGGQIVKKKGAGTVTIIAPVE